MVTYRRVATADQSDDGGSSTGSSRARGMSTDSESNSISPIDAVRSRSERISDKLHARECKFAFCLPTQ